MILIDNPIPAFLFVSMGVLMLIFTVCATRTNVALVLVFLSLFMVFVMLSAAYWRLGLGDSVVGNRCVVVSILHRLSIFRSKFEEEQQNLTRLFRVVELHYSSLVY